MIVFYVFTWYFCGWVYGVIGWLFELFVVRCVDVLFALLFGWVFGCSFWLRGRLVEWSLGGRFDGLMCCVVCCLVV